MHRAVALAAAATYVCCVRMVKRRIRCGEASSRGSEGLGLQVNGNASQSRSAFGRPPVAWSPVHCSLFSVSDSPLALRVCFSLDSFAVAFDFCR
ncbi:hypothetical protein PR003_g11492 [Phytophthora rubi]|uniref:Uncharacterized protein n=1 Tax=Phytophthora rubi TaxID=129364 RepID=A0A6A3N0A5_9STRA|nr:hypothetical protein PR002_g6530 [Phytophthora rubi]KAE9046636.1 hypothetical protein PR001_g4476 [Phytophthora rubi]KAE9338441.1 hypothetical protein PR003_g11492 [Phytophthora rubi]